jgi:hypothetical protein
LRRRALSDEVLLASIAEAVDDGFCPWRELVPRFRPLGDRDLRRNVARAVRRGLLLERRGPDGRAYVALTGEGWALLKGRRAVWGQGNDG